MRTNPTNAHESCKPSTNTQVGQVHRKSPMLNLHMITQLVHSPRVHLVHPTLPFTHPSQYIT